MKLFKRLFALVLLFAVSSGFPATAQTNWTSIFSNVSNAKVKVFPRRPSIIFIQVEGLGYGDLSCYGQTKFQTPNLDKLAADGVRFTDYSVPADAVSSQFEAMTGKKSWRGPSDDLNVAQILKATGYHTGFIGDWNLGDENSATAPWLKGFEEFAGYLNSASADNFYADYVYRFMLHRQTNGMVKDFAGHEMLYQNTRGKNQYLPDLFSKWSQNYAKNNLPDAFNHYQPFFLVLNFKVPSEKIVVPSDAPFSGESWPQAEKNRAALISRIDNYVGDLRAQLDRLRMTNNIAIFFSGATVPEKTSEIDPAFFHSVSSTNDFRAPLIVSLVCWPEKNSVAGKVSNVKCSPTDLSSTAAGIALLDAPKNVDGLSLLPEITGQK
ncbi:MAG TPA: sulfatase-like hydrolase/transferase [Verrucomicrobiae bacterium]|nr:sulfatase-like hydrolase/transferase [Verrucomicrobiae bacterium]